MGLAWLVADLLGLLGGLADYTFVLIALATLVSSQVGIRRYRPPLRWPWQAMALAVTLFLVGGAVRQAVGSFGDLSPQRSLLPDYIVLPGYLLVAAAVGGFVRARWRHRDHDIDAVLDSAVVSLAALTMAWVYLITPALFHQDTVIQVRLSLAVYPPLSVFMAALAVRVAFTAGERMTVAQRLFMTMMTCMVAGDVLATLGDAHLLDVPKNIADLPYALAFLALGATYLHPSMRQLTDPVASDETTPMRTRLLLIAVALTIPALVSMLRSPAEPAERAMLIGMVLALTGVTVARVCRALRQHAAAEARLTFQATHDDLTGLPNRARVMQHIEGSLGHARATGDRLAVIFLDVDHFKLVNDSGGHGLGDELLVAIADRLQRELPTDDMVARLGGDEFVLVLEGIPSRAAAVRRAEQVCNCLQSPFNLRGNDVYVAASLGVVIVESAEAHTTAEAVLRDADTAMYQVKASGRNGVALFDAEMRDRLTERLGLTAGQIERCQHRDQG